MIVVVGPTGQVGSALLGMLDHAESFGRERFDLASLDGDDFGRMLEDLAPTVVINCAAYTAVDRAEDDETVATAVNGDAVGVMAHECGRRGVRFVTYSTDYVFAGTASTPYLESHPTDPINAYGRSKLVGERAALEADGDALVIRTSWVVSGTHPNFTRTMLNLVAGGRRPTVVDDQVGRPTIAADLARATLEAVERHVTGLVHLTNQGDTTWFELARATVRLAGLDEGAIARCSTAEYPTPARRPGYSVLGSEVAPAAGLAPLPHWADSLPELVEMQMKR